MRTVRRQRLAVMLFVIGGAAVTLSLALFALRENVDLFYEPARVVGGDAPVGVNIRAGGMVVDGSVVRAAEGLGATFSITDYRGHEFDVRYVGLLPEMFKEGTGILVRGQLETDGSFHADQLRAKHDENYMPPEVHDVIQGGDIAGSTADASSDAG